MALTARLSSKIREALGPEAAEDMVDWMTHVDANRNQLRELAEVYAARMEARFAEFRRELQADLAELRQHTDAKLVEAQRHNDAKLVELREHSDARFGKVELQMAQMDAKFERRFAELLKWSFVF